MPIEVFISRCKLRRLVIGPRLQFDQTQVEFWGVQVADLGFIAYDDFLCMLGGSKGVVSNGGSLELFDIGIFWIITNI